jgi:hypothetical protein
VCTRLRSRKYGSFSKPVSSDSLRLSPPASLSPSSSSSGKNVVCLRRRVRLRLLTAQLLSRRGVYFASSHSTLMKASCCSLCIGDIKLYGEVRGLPTTKSARATFSRFASLFRLEFIHFVILHSLATPKYLAVGRRLDKSDRTSISEPIVASTSSTLSARISPNKLGECEAADKSHTCLSL